MDKPLISIVVPIYNVESFLYKCLDSILHQTYKNVEILLINDGSTDKSSETALYFSTLDKRFKYFYQENNGLSSARNFGLNYSKGTYITFIDSDDWVAKNYIEELYFLISKHDSDIAICNFEYVGDTFLKNPIEANNNLVILTKDQALNRIYSKFGLNFTVSWGKLYKKKLFENIIFPLNKLHEDEFTTYKLIAISSNIIFTFRALYYYYQRNNSITGVGFKFQKSLDAIEAFEERYNFFIQQKMNHLANRTLVTLFYLYRSFKENLSSIKDINKRNQFLIIFSTFKNRFYHSDIHLFAKLYYLSYFFNGHFFNFLYKLKKIFFGVFI
jgi:glycosyltransferase involved in cell wall biosynthesis